MPGHYRYFSDWETGYYDEHRRLNQRIYSHSRARRHLSRDALEAYIADYRRVEEEIILRRLAHLKPAYDKKMREAAEEEERRKQEKAQRKNEEQKRKQEEERREKEERRRRSQQKQHEYYEQNYFRSGSGSRYSYTFGSSSQSHESSGQQRSHRRQYQSYGYYNQDSKHQQDSQRPSAQQKEQERKKKAEEEECRIEKRYTEYHNGWNGLRDRQGQLRFLTIPWPVLEEPTGPGVVTVPNIRAFFNHPTYLAPNHWDGKKRQLQKEFLRWHTDKFRSMTLSRVREEDQKIVGDLAEMVIRVLNDVKAQC